MKKNAEKRIVRQEDSKQLVLSIARGMHEVLHDLVVGAGMTVFQAMLEQDRVELCGPRYVRDAGRDVYRAGSAPGELAMGGRRVRCGDRELVRRRETNSTFRPGDVSQLITRVDARPVEEATGASAPFCPHDRSGHDAREGSQKPRNASRLRARSTRCKCEPTLAKS